MSVGIVVVCEAPGDFHVATCLIDRSLCEEGPTWLREFVEHSLEAARTWITHDHNAPFMRWKHVDTIATSLGVRSKLGHFSGQPKARDALAVRKALAIVHALRKQNDQIQAAVLVRDIDNAPERSDGFAQAIEEAKVRDPNMGIVIGLPDPEMEAWLLAGFDPENAEEETRLSAAKKALGKDPRAEAHELRASHDHDERSVKRVLKQLTNEDNERREACYRQTPLATLRSRGDRSGLKSFLDQIPPNLVPLFTGPRASS